MPFDQKRINGPDVSFSYKLYNEEALQLNPIVKPTKISRTDRADNESRKLAVQLGVISKSKGSCYIEIGNTKIIVAVFELREIPRQNKYIDKGQLYVDFKYAPFARQNRKSVSENEEKLMSSSIKTSLQSAVCLHEFPNYQMDVFINVLEDDGSVLAASIIAAGLAFVDASIPMFDLITATSVGVIDDSLLVDPSASEEEMMLNSANPNHGSITISSLSSLDQVSQILQNGYIKADVLKEAKKKILETNKKIIPYLKKIISLKMEKETNET